MSIFLRTKDFLVSGETFDLIQDPELEMLVTNPQPENLQPYYNSEQYISHTDASGTLLEKAYQFVKSFNLNRKLALVEKYRQKKKSLLDIGAGTADFLIKAEKQGWVVDGVEPNLLARERASQKGVKLHPDFKALGGRRFEIITLWHVLEHLPELKQQLFSITNLLEDDGTLVLAVPNFKSRDAKYYNTHWAGYDTPRHLWHFSKKAIEKLLRPHNMEIISIRPLIFDAFYVSLLSEKYKGNPVPWLGAFFIGLWSNISAWRSGEYSSLIYVLKKA